MTILQEAPSTSILAGGLYKKIVEAAVAEVKKDMELYILNTFGKSYEYILHDYYENESDWWNYKYNDNYMKLKTAFMKYKYVQTDNHYGDLSPIIENYLQPFAHNNELIVYTNDPSNNHAASHTGAWLGEPCKIFINHTKLPMYLPDVILPHATGVGYELVGVSDNKGFPKKLDSFSIKWWTQYIDISAIKKLVSVVIHEFTHNMQQHALDGKNVHKTEEAMVNTKINNEKNVYASGNLSTTADDKVHKYAYHFVSNIEQHAIAEDSLTEVLFDYIDFLDDDAIDKFKNLPEINNNPSNLAKLVLKKWNKRGINIDPKTKKPYSVNTDDKTGAMAQKHMITFIAKVVHTWWFDKSELLADDIAKRFEAVSRGASKRDTKKNTREYRMHNGTLPTVDTSKVDKAVYSKTYMRYIPNTITVLPESIDISYLKKRASAFSRNNVLCTIISSLYSNKLGVPVKVVNAEKTKFDLPVIELNTNDYIDEFVKTPIGVYGTIENATATAFPIEYAMKEMQENPKVISTLIIDSIDLLRMDNTQLPVSYFKALYSVADYMNDANISKWIYSYNSAYSKRSDIQDVTAMRYLTQITGAFLKKICSDNDILQNPDFENINITPHLIEPGDSTDGVAIHMNSIAEIIVDNMNSVLRNVFASVSTSVSFKKAYNEIYNDRSVLVPLVQKMVNDIDATFVPKVEKINLTKQELSQLRKALKAVNMAALSKEDSVTELRIALSKLLPQYKSMILDSGAVSEKNKTILRKFMSM